MLDATDESAMEIGQFTHFNACVLPFTAPSRPDCPNTKLTKSYSSCLQLSSLRDDDPVADANPYVLALITVEAANYTRLSDTAGRHAACLQRPSHVREAKHTEAGHVSLIHQ
jgi:hypothetical protein